MRAVPLLAPLLLSILLAGCNAEDEHQALADLARDVSVPSGGSLVASGVVGLGPQETQPYVGYAYHRYAPDANASRLVDIVRADLADKGWGMEPVQVYGERSSTGSDAFVPIVSTLGRRADNAIEVKAATFEGGRCCAVTDEPGVGVLLVIRVRGT